MQDQSNNYHVWNFGKKKKKKIGIFQKSHKKRPLKMHAQAAIIE